MKNKEKSIDVEIQRVIDNLGLEEPGSEEYKALISNLNELTKDRALMHGPAIDKNTIISAVTNLVGIILVLDYEKLGVVSSKAWSSIKKIF